jgi:outer membrane lipoprotein-sorting protein
MNRSNRILALLVLFSLSTSAWALSPMEILKKADAIRMPRGDADVSCHLTSNRKDLETSSADYEVLFKGAEKTLIKTMAPATDRGTSILMLGRDLWVYMQDVSKPVRVSLQQRLMGEIANGDLARANFQGDYTPTLASQGKAFYELKLMAVSEDVTYGQVRLWVDKKSYRPLRAAFYASSGRLLKIGHYEDYKMMSGTIRPARLVFEDAIEKNKKSTIVYKSIKSADWPEKFFTKDYLKKLKY